MSSPSDSMQALSVAPSAITQAVTVDQGPLWTYKLVHFGSNDSQGHRHIIALKLRKSDADTTTDTQAGEGGTSAQMPESSDLGRGCHFTGDLDHPSRDSVDVEHPDDEEVALRFSEETASRMVEGWLVQSATRHQLSRPSTKGIIQDNLSVMWGTIVRRVTEILHSNTWPAIGWNVKISEPGPEGGNPMVLTLDWFGIDTYASQEPHHETILALDHVRAVEPDIPIQMTVPGWWGGPPNGQAEITPSVGPPTLGPATPPGRIEDIQEEA